jgi:acyl-CoA reductase-like NAD-dependent aldehyde dehydrogenase
MNMPEILTVTSPVDGQPYVERRLATGAEIRQALQSARRAQLEWRAVAIPERAAFLARAIDAFVARTDPIALEITRQMGRPIRFAPGEVRGFEERARYMIAIAEETLADLEVGKTPGFTRFIRRMPLGTVLVIAPWNYPYLTAVNAVFPALMAGNAVILKHSAQTPLCAERFAEALGAAGLPEGVFHYLHMDHAATTKVIASGEVDFVSFTGSVAAGHGVQEAAAGGFAGVSLELGGKDPAYVRADANLDHAIENLADGAFFNSGQSCCAIERIYVQREVHDRFVDGLVAFTKSYRLGDPTDPATTLGPMVRPAAGAFARSQIKDAVARGATALLDPRGFDADQPGSAYMAPQILINVDHSMRVMVEETFAPVVGVMSVESDAEAVRLMNDSRYGLSGAIWTSDEDAAVRIGNQIETGTWFMNRCDYLDPALAWVGIKDSGRGCSLSRLGYATLTRPKSFHLRTQL